MRVCRVLGWVGDGVTGSEQKEGLRASRWWVRVGAALSGGGWVRSPLLRIGVQLGRHLGELSGRSNLGYRWCNGARTGTPDVYISPRLLHGS